MIMMENLEHSDSPFSFSVEDLAQLNGQIAVFMTESDQSARQPENAMHNSAQMSVTSSIIYMADYTDMFSGYDRFADKAQDVFTYMMSMACICPHPSSPMETLFESSMSFASDSLHDVSTEENHDDHGHCATCGAEIEKGGVCAKCTKH
jgi:hypothetical protein